MAKYVISGVKKGQIKELINQLNEELVTIDKALEYYNTELDILETVDKRNGLTNWSGRYAMKGIKKLTNCYNTCTKIRNELVGAISNLERTYEVIKNA